MQIKLKEITIGELANGYQDNAENGIVGYGGKLDIRPPYQRNFIYNETQRNAVIDTVSKNFPLNVMYWAVREDGNFEVIDGQQRTISICQYVKGFFSCRNLFGRQESLAFHNLTGDQQEKILNYKLMVYFCSGSQSEKLEWFETINIAGEELTKQELRNAVYVGSWVADAKKWFSKSGCPAYSIGNKYLNGELNRQIYLETAIKWISNDAIDTYMSDHQHNPNANELWMYFQSVINWIETTFGTLNGGGNYRREMKGLNWGMLYNKFKDKQFDTNALEQEIAKLMQDDDVTAKKGIYEYVLDRKEKHLNIREFTPNQKREAYERQNGICAVCNEHFEINQMEADHITPWHRGGKTVSENCQMLCVSCNREKSGK